MKQEIDPVDAALRAHAAQPVASKFLAAVVVIVAVVLLGWIGAGLSRLVQAAAESRIIAHAETEWSSLWAGQRTVEGVATNLYQADDPVAWGERHRVLVLGAIKSRPQAED
jgi:hypothetical protein